MGDSVLNKLVIVAIAVGMMAGMSVGQDRTSATTQSAGALPDVLVLADGTRVTSAAQWPVRRAQILELVQQHEYGPLPPAGGETTFVEIISHRVPTGPHRQCKVKCGPGGAVSFVLDVMLPKGKAGEKFPVILRGDWCWGKTAPAFAEKILARGYALAELNRCEIAPDNAGREIGLSVAYPSDDFGAIAAWAWGFHRSIDVLEKLPDVDSTKIAVVGHSRGGKASLLAGATDERVALTIANNSGAGGAGSFTFQPADCETLERITRAFPYWFSPRLREFAGKEQTLGFDQHFVKALCAPRALLTTEALGDKWANPSGTMRTHEGARAVYKLLGAEDRLGIYFREGKHEHNEADWMVMLDFADQVLLGKKSSRDFASDPFAK